MKHISKPLIAVLALSLPLVAGAFDLPKIPKAGGGSDSTAAADLGGQQEKVVKDYVAANKDVLGANEKMLAALGLKNEAATAKATAAAFTDSPTKGNLADADKAVDASTKALTAAIESKPQLSADSKKLYAEGLVSLLSGVGKYAGMKGSVQTFASGLKGASILEAPKLQAGAYVAQTFPSNLMNLGKTTKSAVDFAKSADIPVPKESDDMLATLSAL